MCNSTLSPLPGGLCSASPPSGASRPDEPDSASDDGGDPYYAVERIVAIFKVAGNPPTLKYEIKWEEAHETSNEPEGNLLASLVDEFREEHPELVAQALLLPRSSCLAPP